MAHPAPRHTQQHWGWAEDGKPEAETEMKGLTRREHTHTHPHSTANEPNSTHAP